MKNSVGTSYLHEILGLSRQAAMSAGEIILESYGKPISVRHKGEIDLVTEVDLASEKAILGILNNGFQDIDILSEEEFPNYDSLPRNPLWIVDPLDGTTNFAHGFPYFCVSIAYVEEGFPLTGLVYCPVQNELFEAVKGEGAWLNGNRIKVSETNTLKQALLATGFPYEIKNNLQDVLALLERILPEAQDLRRAGAAAMDLAYLSCGRLDGFWEMGLKPWDTAAGQLLVLEAGGKVTNYSGELFSPFLPEIVASNNVLHHELLKLIAKPS